MADPSPPHVHLKRFSGLPNENWPEFERLLRASIAVSRIPEANHQRARYLHLHLAGNALNYYLRLAENTRNDLDDSLEQLRNRYAGADQRRNFELDLQSRKFDPVKEQPDDFLTDLQRLANLAIVDDPAAHIDRTDERTRRIREQFIQGMPFKYKNVLLKENDNITVNELCAIIKRRVRIDQINPEPQYTTAFNTLNASGNPAVARAIESIMAAGIASMQVAQPPYQRVESTQYPSYRRGNNYRGYNHNRQTYQYNGNQNGRGYNNNYNSRGRNRGSFQRGRGNYSRGRSNFQRNDRSNGRTERSPTPMRTFCRTCASNEHTARDCPERQPAYRDGNMPFNQQSKN